MDKISGLPERFPKAGKKKGSKTPGGHRSESSTANYGGLDEYESKPPGRGPQGHVKIGKMIDLDKGKRG